MIIENTLFNKYDFNKIHFDSYSCNIAVNHILGSQPLKYSIKKKVSYGKPIDNTPWIVSHSMHKNKRRGRPKNLPQYVNVSISFRLPSFEKEAIREYSNKRDQSMTQTVLEALLTHEGLQSFMVIKELNQLKME